MKKLSKAQEHQRQSLCAEVEQKRDALEEQVQLFNHTLAEEWIKVEARLADVNDAIGSLNAFIDDITDEMDGYLSERSERWQESDVGQDYDAWKQQWQEAKLSEAELEAPADVEMTEVPVEQVRDLPDSPE